MNYLLNNIEPKAYFLDEEQISKMHSATLKILGNTGIKIEYSKIIDILADSGARVSNDRVCFPSWMVEEALNKAPSIVPLSRRNSNTPVVISNDSILFGPTLDCIDYLEPLTNNRRAYVSEDCRINASLVDGLENFTWVMTFGLADDIEPDIADRVIAKQALTYCEKPLAFCCGSLESNKAIYDMSLLITGSEAAFKKAPNIASIVSPTSPLALSEVTIERIMFSAEKGIPLIICPAPAAGATSPISLAGTIVQANAETLSGLIIAQIIRPGAPVIFGAFPSIMDMKSTIFSYGAPEFNMMSAAFCQIAKSYLIPSFGTGGCSDAKFIDIQTAVEATFSLLSSALTGANMIHDSGIIDHGSLASPALNVLINEIIGMIKMYKRGITVNDDEIALEVINCVGPCGNYLQEDHTLKHFRDIWYPNLFERMDYEKWMSEGGRSFEERLTASTKVALEHKPSPLPFEIVKEMDKIAKHCK